MITIAADDLSVDSAPAQAQVQCAPRAEPAIEF
jgi:hypothetical protein